MRSALLPQKIIEKLNTAKSQLGEGGLTNYNSAAFQNKQQKYFCFLQKQSL